MQVGDKFTWVPSEWLTEKTKYANGQSIPNHVKGRVVWIHPKKRFFLAEGEVNGTVIRETFPMERR